MERKKVRNTEKKQESVESKKENINVWWGLLDNDSPVITSS